MAAKQRWRLLAKACASKPGDTNQEAGQPISRVATGSFGLVSARELTSEAEVDTRVPAGLVAADSLHYFVSYRVTKPCGSTAEIVLKQRRAGSILLSDHRVSQTCGVDTTGVVCLWPAEEVMTYYCLQHPKLFRGKRVVELGAGYGLAGLAIAACTEAREVVLTDGNPQVLEVLRQNVRLNAHLFGGTFVRVEPLFWGNKASLRAAGGPYDVIIAADCTFFKDYHAQLATTIKCLLTRTPAPGTCTAEMPELEDPVEDEATASSPSNRDHMSPFSQGETSAERPQGDGNNKGVSAVSFTKDTLGQYGSDVRTAGGRKDPGISTSGNFSERLRSEGDCASTSAELTDSGGDVLQGFDLSKGIVNPDEIILSRQFTERLGQEGTYELEREGPLALLFNPKRGGTLDRFVEVARQAGLLADVSESFDEEVDQRNVRLKGGGCADWPGYSEEHCRPHLLNLRPLHAP